MPSAGLACLYGYDHPMGQTGFLSPRPPGRGSTQPHYDAGTLHNSSHSGGSRDRAADLFPGGRRVKV